MKHFISGLAKLTAASILVISLVACGGAEERKATYLEKGKTYLEEKNYDKARVEFKNVLQIDPKFGEAYYYMGQLEEKKNELAKALGNYKKAISLDPELIDAKIKLAKIYVIAGTADYTKEAKKLLSQVKKAQPDNAEAAFISATIKYKSGLKQEGIADLEKIIAKNKTMVEGVSLLSTFYMASGEEDKARKVLLDGVKHNKESTLLRFTLAKLLAKNGDLVNSEKYLLEALKIDPENYRMQVALASFYATSDQLDKAEALLRKAIKQDDEDVQRYLVLVEMLATRVSLKKADEELKAAIKKKPDLYKLKFAQVKFYKRVGKRAEAKDVLIKIIADKPLEVEGVNARNELAKHLLEEGDFKGAKKYADEVIAEHPNNNDGLLVTSKLALVKLDATTAINGLRTVVKNNPKNAEASLLLAQAYEVNKETALAENELKKSIEANPANDQAHANYARYLGSKGRIDEAIAVIDKALTYFKDSYSLMDIKLKIVVTQNKEAEIVALLNMMEQVDPSKAEVNLVRGQYYLSKKNMDEAVEEYEKAYQKSRDKYKPLKMIVTSYMIFKQPEKALSRLQKNIDENPDDSIALLLMGQVYLEQKKIVEAREKFKQASKISEAWGVPYENLALTYLAEKNVNGALTVYKNAVAKVKNKVPLQLKISAIYEQEKNYSAAMEIYQDILSVQPENKLAANNYASLLLDYGSDTDALKALELAKTFEKLPQPALLDTLAWAYVKTGDNAKAVEILKPIVEKAPKIAVFRYHLGFALFEMGDKSAAKSHLEIAVSSKQNYPGKDKAQALLKSI